MKHVTCICGNGREMQVNTQRTVAWHILFEIHNSSFDSVTFDDHVMQGTTFQFSRPRTHFKSGSWPQLIDVKIGPPKGDRSEGFYIKNPILIDLGLFGPILIENHITLYEN